MKRCTFISQVDNALVNHIRQEFMDTVRAPHSNFQFHSKDSSINVGVAGVQVGIGSIS